MDIESRRRLPPYVYERRLREALRFPYPQGSMSGVWDIEPSPRESSTALMRERDSALA
jgi:hypothetical protein